LLPLTLLFGVGLFLWQLGSTGLVDETPPLFAGAARAMAETGDWLTPRVNGLPRYDKPPLVYWLMGLGYLVPGQDQWNPLGTWAARLPSALASIAVMLSLAYTLRRWPQPDWAPGSGGDPLPPRPALTALSASLGFALSPLILLWGRIAVSDALFTGCLTMSLLLFWQSWAEPRRPWWPAWLVLGLAVLAKGPVAVVLAGLTLLGFGWRQGAIPSLWRRLRPIRGLGVTAVVALPWYGAMLLVEGRPFWNSFFGYHNLQRFSSVVNQHLQPWWFFAAVLVVASLPFTPLLLLGLARGLRGPGQPPPASLRAFAACWLMSVLLFFTLAATKLPSYWLPATPAAGILIALAAQDGETPPRHSGGDGSASRSTAIALGVTLLLTVLLASGLWVSGLWIPAIQDPEMPTLPAELLASGLVLRAAFCWTLTTLLAAWLWLRGRRPVGWLLALQLPVVAFQLVAVLPMWALGDGVRGRPVREMAAAVRRQAQAGEPLAMVGILKPSLHYYSRQVVLYEGTSQTALVNLADRLRREERLGQTPSLPEQQPTVLVVIDGTTAGLPHWQNLRPQVLEHSGLYSLWRLDRRRLEQRAAVLVRKGGGPTWQRPVPEKY
jgi:4-amino-4-deoxy-L-arabinose transferase-like glycosyltransferase